MILLGDFFDIVSLETKEGEINALIEINAEHNVFNGHFPGQPVVPGVCQVQMIKEILEQAMEKETMLSTAAEMKFRAIIDPTQNNSISATIKYSIEEDKVKVIAGLFKDTLVHFGFKGTFTLP